MSPLKCHINENVTLEIHAGKSLSYAKNIGLNITYEMAPSSFTSEMSPLKCHLYNVTFKMSPLHVKLSLPSLLGVFLILGLTW